MKASILSLFVAAQAVVGAVVDIRDVCRADNCNRAVIGTQRGSAFVTQAKADCSSFMAGTTVTPTPTQVAQTVTVTATILGSATETLATATITSPITVTVTAPAVTVSSFSIVQAIQASVPAKRSVGPSVPTYASACSGAARYSSACSCYGITGGTATASQPTITVTPTNSVFGITVTATNTITASPTATIAVGVCDHSNNSGIRYSYPMQFNGVGQTNVINDLNLYPGITNNHGCCVQCFNTRSCTTYYFNGTACANTAITGANAALVTDQCPFGIANERGNVGGNYFGLGPCVKYLGPSGG